MPRNSSLLLTAAISMSFAFGSIALGETAPAPGTVFRDCPDCPEMVVIPAGAFTMGGPAADSKSSQVERPLHRVTFARPFAIGKHTVTFAEYDACVAADGCERRPQDERWGRGRQPVVDISWNEAVGYVAWLARKTGKSYRLPSEAEWEYAARAGTTTRYPWGDAVGRNRANCDGCGSRWDDDRPAPVGSFAPNSFGLYDMHGNVRQWLADCWHDDYKGAPADGAPWLIGGDCSYRVIRGGSFEDDADFIRSSWRTGSRPGSAHRSHGFRLVRTFDEVGQRTEEDAAKRRASEEAVMKVEEDLKRRAEEAARKRAAPVAPGRVFRDCPDCPEMAEIPAGSFLMGVVPRDRPSYETVHLHHPVTIATPFALGKYTVTFAEYDACVDAGGCSHRPSDIGWGRGRQPVIRVSWKDAKAYAAWLSKKTGKSYRLPSETEWEYAARAGTTTRYPWGDQIGKGNANGGGFDSSAPWGGRPAPVGSFPPNALGLHDMHGNVDQWLEDCFHGNYQGAPTDGAAWLTGSDCGHRVIRGGNWNSNFTALSSAARSQHVVEFRNADTIGFRVARGLD